MSPDHLIGGAFIGSILVFIAIAIPRYTRFLLAAGLVVAAIDYTGFALYAGAGPLWLAIELAGVAIYGALALRGFRRSAWWLAAGWALHPVWDVALHFAGPGRTFAPEWYTVSCITWDLATAAIIAIAIIVGTHLSAAAPMSFRASEAAAVIPSGASTKCSRSRGIALLPIERPLCREDCDSSTPGLRPCARNDSSCTCPFCSATEAHAA